MPEMTYTPVSYNDQTALADGWHPAYLMAITDEATPDSWKMFEKSPRMWRWHFMVWATPDQIATVQPERQSAPSSQKFIPKGRQPASKAYAWTSALLQRQFAPGESVNLDPMMPLPCRVKLERSATGYGNILDVEAWLDGAAYLTPELRAKLQHLREHPPERPATPPASTQSPAHTAPAAAYAATTPGMGQTWGQPASQLPPPPATPGKSAW